MQSVGQQIREQRQRLGLQLEDIAATSRISVRMLKAIEEDDLASIGAPFLYKNFTRQLAHRIQLDYKTLEQAVESAAHSIPEPLMPGEQDHSANAAKSSRVAGKAKKFPWAYSLATLSFAVVGCSSLYGLWRSSKSGAPGEVGREKADAKTPEKERAAETCQVAGTRPTGSRAIRAGKRSSAKSAWPAAKPATQRPNSASAKPGTVAD